jgi:hypothetical protein
MSPRRRLLLDDGNPSASRADQSAAALHDMSETFPPISSCLAQRLNKLAD